MAKALTLLVSRLFQIRYFTIDKQLSVNCNALFCFCFVFPNCVTLWFLRHYTYMNTYTYPDASPSTPVTPLSLGVPPYPLTGSPEGIPTLEHLEINDSKGSPRSPSRHSLLGKEGPSDQGLVSRTEPQSPQTAPSHPACSRVSQPHNCDLCGLIFSSEHFLKFHKDIIHSKKEFFDVTCKLCKEKFKDFEAYRNHVRENHSDRRYICDQCPKTFKMKGSLLVHMRMFHDPSSPGTCQLCKKTFTTKARKELHEKRYHGVGLEHIPSGKTSPTSPSQKQHKAKNSSLGDAKSWLETLIIETRPTGDESNRCREVQEQQSMQTQPPLSHHLSMPYSSQQTENKRNEGDNSNDPLGNQFAVHLPSSQEEAEKNERSTRDMQTQISEDLQKPQKNQPTEADPQQMQRWGSDMQPFLSAHDKVCISKNIPDTYYQHQKNCINLPGQGRSRSDCNEFKQDKKFSVLHHGGETSTCRTVGGSYTQQSPVAIVSPQPQKSETPPVDKENSLGCHTEARRNSFPLVNVAKLGLSQQDASQLHSANYINDLSHNASSAVSSLQGQNMGMDAAGNKMTMSQQTIYHQDQSAVPVLSSSLALSGTENKIGVKVAPLLMSGTQVQQIEKVKEPPDSPMQIMQVQDDSCTSEVMKECDFIHEAKISPEMQQEQKLEGAQLRHHTSAGMASTSIATATTTTPTTVTRKESTGKTDAKQWECDVCKKSFTTKYFLKKHKRLHTGETPYACAECGKTFTFQQSYHKHILYHSDDKPHQCSYCGRAFKEMSTLHNHVRIHTGEKPFVCENCGKAFRQRVSYLVHQRIHTGVMPYTCEACGRSFRYKVSLRSHKCEPSSSQVTSSSSSSIRAPEGSAEIRGQSGTHTATNASTSTPIILLPQLGVMTKAESPRKQEESGDSHSQQMITLCTQSTNASSRETSYFNNNEHQQNQLHQKFHKLQHLQQEQQHQLHQQQEHQQPQQQQHQNLLKHQEVSLVEGRNKAALETIDLSAITCEGLPSPSVDIKKSPIRSNRSPSQNATARTGGTGVPYDPISVAFMHALVDPQQGRLQGDCRPHFQPPLQEGMTFPGFSPGSMDTDLDHDNFLTNLLM